MTTDGFIGGFFVGQSQVGLVMVRVHHPTATLSDEKASLVHRFELKVQVRC